jgi:hypothetical protein
MRENVISLKSKLRQAVADYMSSEGCSCCRNIEDHRLHEKTLAEMLDVEPYSDGSGYNFNKYCSPEHKTVIKQS